MDPITEILSDSSMDMIQRGTSISRVLLPLLSAFILALPECQFLLDGLVGHQLGLNGWQKLTFQSNIDHSASSHIGEPTEQ